MRFTDLHLHNAAPSFYWLWPSKERHMRKGQYHPWHIVSDNRKKRRKGRMGSAYSQSDLVKANNGKLRLAFNSLYPLEKGFFDSLPKNLRGPNRALKWVTHILSSNALPLRDFLHIIGQHIPDALIDYLQSDEFDYWDFLNEEYEFILQKNDIETRNSIFTPYIWRKLFESERRRRRKNADEMDSTGTYRIPKNKQELVHSLSTDAITMILTIEGAHSFGTDQLSTGKKSLVDCLNRLRHLRQNWDHPIFFITFAHHFNNNLCGHAHSFPSEGEFIFNQNEGLNGPFQDEGRRFVRHLYALDDNNDRDPSKGYRILIDVKHMSATSRKQLYSEFIEPCYSKGDIIPVIASHCAYSGIRTLQEHIDHYDIEKDNSFAQGKFNNWNINICDEDLEMIYKTEGLFGLSMDQRILGVHRKDKEANQGRNSIKAIWFNIEAVLRVFYDKTNWSSAKKHKAWKIISLGSDFGGWIDPINKYRSVLKYKDLRTDLIETIRKERVNNSSPTIVHLDTDAKLIEAVDDICYKNAEHFVLKHYPDV